MHSDNTIVLVYILKTRMSLRILGNHDPQERSSLAEQPGARQGVSTRSHGKAIHLLGSVGHHRFFHEYYLFRTPAILSGNRPLSLS
jgi:hypothetical protein